ncbi:MAG: hypothetical protein ABIN95_05950 [Mucilaginibacter sp.]
MKKILQLAMAAGIAYSLQSCKKADDGIQPVTNPDSFGTLKSSAACAGPPSVIGVRITGGSDGCETAGRIYINSTNGNINVRGVFGGTVDVDPGVGVFNLTGANRSIYNQTFNANGDFLGAIKELQYTESMLFPKDAEGNKYSGKVVGDSTYIIKTNALGVEIWRAKAGPPPPWLRVADFTVTLKLDPWNNVYFSNMEGELYKFNPQGQLVYKKIKRDINARITIDKTGNVYLYGSTGRLQKISPEGNIIWEIRNEPTTVTPPQIQALTVDDEGNIYSAGTFIETSDLDPGPGVFKLIPLGRSMFVQKLNSSGQFVWALQTEGKGVNDNQIIPYDIKLDSTGDHIIVAGSFRGSIFFDAGNKFIATSKGSCDDAFVMGIKQCK